MSKSSRGQGLALMVLGLLVFAGTTNQMLPAVAFWPALATCCIGIVIFMKANRIVMDEAETQTRRDLNPTIRNKSLERFAESQQRTDGRVLAGLERRNAAPTTPASATATQIQEDEIVLYEVDDHETESNDSGFVVSTDVSFPIEIQEQGALADQLEKLKRLNAEGILSDDEFDAAKAKLLS